MKILKWIGIVILLIVAILFVISLFLPKTFKTEASIVIDAPAWSVYEEVADYTNWTKWDPWNAADTNMKNIVTGDVGIGHKREWVSESQGSGSLETIEFEENKMVKSKLMFVDMDSPSFNTFLLEEADGGTKTTWIIEGEIGFSPIGRYMMLISKSMMKKAFDDGLNNLKVICEAKPKEKAPVIEVVAKEFPGIKYLAIKHIITDMNEIGALAGQDYGQLMTFMGEAKIDMVGAPFSRYIQFSEVIGDTIIFESCIPVAEEVKGKGDIYFAEIMPGNIVSAIHFGAYDKIGAVYYAIEDYIKANELECIGAPWEVYLTDPGMEPDTSRWMTEVFYPVN
ncbi:SRPBCC family protein [Bacteroidota bacterium]